MAGRDVRQVVVPFSSGDDVFPMGEIVAADHPAVKANPSYFGDVKVREAPVEQATAAPGEKRTSNVRGRKKAEPEPEIEPETGGLKKADIRPLKK